MSERFSLEISTGVVFSLMTDYMCKETTPSQSLLLQKLLIAGVDTYNEDLIDGPEVTRFKHCFVSRKNFRDRSASRKKVARLPFYQSSHYVPAFDENVRQHYSETAQHMTDFVDEYLLSKDKGKMKELANALLTILFLDDTIKPQDELYIDPAGKAVKKESIYGMNPICLDSLLLGLWHFVVCHRTEMNTNGRKAILWLYGEKNDAEKNKADSLRIDFTQSIGWEYDLTRWTPTRDAPSTEETAQKTMNDDKQESAKSEEDPEMLKRLLGALGSSNSYNSGHQEYVEGEPVDEEYERAKTSNSHQRGTTVIKGDQNIYNGPVIQNTGKMVINNRY